MTSPCNIDLAVFAYNEEANITALLDTLERQDIGAQPDLSLRVLICANGCTDQTVAVARREIKARGLEETYVVLDLAEGGKSRTWNTFVHDASRPDADYLIFCDADIVIPDRDMLTGLVRFIRDRPALVAAQSRPVKDITYDPQGLSSLDKLISAAAGTLNDWRTSICGQLYVMRAHTARGFHLPVGLPVEDGFVRAMIVTDVFRARAQKGLIDGDDALFHVYASERSIGALIRHQVRIVIGGAINVPIYTRLSNADDPPALLKQAAADPNWLRGLIREALPRRYGYVPRSFLTKRLRGFRAASARRKLVLLVGTGFDAVVYVIAQFKMMRGQGVGFW